MTIVCSGAQTHQTGWADNERDQASIRPADIEVLMFSHDPNSARQPFMMPPPPGLDPAVGAQLHHAEFRTALERPRDTAMSYGAPRWRALFARMTRKRPSLLFVDHELFAGLDQKQLARAGELFDVVQVREGRSLGQQGETVTEFVTILEGRIGVSIDGVPHAVLDDGSQFGALSLLDDERPTHRASFDVMAPSRIAVVTAERFPAMLRELPDVAERIRAIARVRRAYLAGLAAGAAGDAGVPTGPLVAQFPVHLPHTGGSRPRREVMQVRSGTSR